MKLVKIFGPAAVAAMALIAVIGAGTASATVLCSEGNLTESCAPHGKVLGVETVIKASLAAETSVTLEDTSGGFQDVCTTATIEGKVTNAGGEAAAVLGAVTSLTLEECTATTAVLKMGTLSITWIKGGDNGTIVSENAEVDVEFDSFLCGYNTGVDIGTLKGAAMATMEIKAVINRTTNSPGFCPPTLRWGALYTVTAPEPLFVAKK